MATVTRIYQGRLLSAGGEAAEHFRIFQAAINYYLLALAAQETREHGPLADLRRQMSTCWGTWIDRSGTRRDGLRALVGEWLDGLAGRPVTALDDAFSLLRAPDGGQPDAPWAAVALLLERCQGESAIRDHGRAYWPRFCDPKCSPTWDYRGDDEEHHRQGVQDLQLLVRADPAPSAAEMETLAARMSITWADIKVYPDQFKAGKDARERLAQAVSQMDLHAEGRQRELLDADPTAWEATKARIASLPEERLRIPKNRKAALPLTSAALLFQFAPSELTRRLLSCALPKPSRTTGAKPRADAAPASAWLGVAQRVGVDPILHCRGDRGYLFPAFTALLPWAPAREGQPTWKDFDIAAFKGALLTLNQVRLKTEERATRRAVVLKSLAYMDGASDDLKGTRWEAEGSEERPARLGLDKRWTKLKALLAEDLAVSNEFTDEEEVAYALRTRTLRGFTELRERWLATLARRKGASDADVQQQLLAQLHKYQAANAGTMGSATLLTALCEPARWDLWAPADPAGGTPVDDLFAAHAAWLELRAESDRLALPIRFTPADARYSARAYDLSGIKNREADLRWEPEGNVLSAGLATRRDDGGVECVRTTLRFSAPRLLRDGLAGVLDAAARHWCPPLVEALALPARTPCERLACGLMPHPSGDPARGMVLNFPATLPVDALQAAFAGGVRWNRAFNTTKDREHLHLLWPDTANPAQREAGWWLDPAPFDVLAVDLGQRTAAAAAQLRVHSGSGRETWWLGETDGRAWWAELGATRLLRLPGEDSTAPGGVHHEQDGRSATPEETSEAEHLVERLALEATSFTFRGRSFPRQNDTLLVAFRRAQGRLRRNLRWLWLLGEPARRERALREMAEQEANPNLAAEAAAGDLTALDLRLRAAIEHDRKVLPGVLACIADRAAPRVRHRWEWRPHAQVEGAWCLALAPHRWASRPRIRGQRGLSLARIEQLDELRRRVQAHNRLHQRIPGSAPPSPRTTRAQPLPEPAQPLLDKIEELKRQRVNQTAHLILAEAMGVRLRTSHTLPLAQRRAGDHHGEYEPIPGRRPVSMVVLEDLSRYLASQQRGRAENARLMKWCHRAIIDKLTQLLEPFGIPLLTVNPAYSSRFCSRSGVPGFRAVEVTLSNASDFAWREDVEGPIVRPGESEPPLQRTVVREAFDALRDLEHALGARPGKPPFTLLLPKAGGPLFVPASRAWGAGTVTQADINAAINLGLRAVASPRAWVLQPRVAVEWREGRLSPRGASKLVKARFPDAAGTRFVGGDPSDKADNLFYIHPALADRLGATITVTGHEDLAFATGRALWGRMKGRLQWAAARRINDERVRRWQEKYDLNVPF